ncbi:MAG TPA: hypothetical protein VMN79_10000 [Casimicrobiaceae bacterium]|nr:hypothetical protein [Casimicrobiaceae bacterium]
MIRLLCDAGYEVIGTTLLERSAEALRVLGAAPVVIDVFDAAAATVSGVFNIAEPNAYVSTGRARSALQRHADLRLPARLSSMWT